MALCIICYIAVPNGHSLRPEIIEGSDIFSVAVRLLQGVDPPMNVCPSLHVLVTLHLCLAWVRSRTPLVLRHPWIRGGAVLLALSIMAATVLLKQHSIIDVLCGAGLGALLDLLLCRTLVPRVCAFSVPDERS